MRRLMLPSSRPGVLVAAVVAEAVPRAGTSLAARAELRQDRHEHVHGENDVLFPRALAAAP